MVYHWILQMLSPPTPHACSIIMNVLEAWLFLQALVHALTLYSHRCVHQLASGARVANRYSTLGSTRMRSLTSLASQPLPPFRAVGRGFLLDHRSRYLYLCLDLLHLQDDAIIKWREKWCSTWRRGHDLRLPRVVEMWWWFSQDLTSAYNVVKVGKEEGERDLIDTDHTLDRSMILP